jgi:hypothetical protein
MRASPVLLTAALALGLAAPGLAGCVRFSTQPLADAVYPLEGERPSDFDPGPPPRAPAHGHRHRHVSGVTLVYDATLDLYRVEGREGTYYCEARFYERIGSRWASSDTVGGHFVGVPTEALPPPLRRLAPEPGQPGGIPADRAL